MEQGLFFIIYAPDTLQDFLHVDNLAQAHELAGQALSKEKEFCAVSSRACFFMSEPRVC